jgi:hypothetical protein
MKMKVYPDKPGALCVNPHPGSYTGQDAFNDMLPVILNSSWGGIAATLDASYYKGTGARNGNEREYIAILKKVRA